MDNQKSTQFLPSTTYYGFILVKIGSAVCGRFPVTKKEVDIGRDNNCDIRILLDNVSSIHCTVHYLNDKAYIRDKSVSGTTKVNGKNIGRNNFLLHHLDEINICGRKFVWEYANSYIGLNLPSKKSGVKKDCSLLRASERISLQANTPLVPQDSNKILTSATSTAKTLIRCHKTPIVVTATNMSNLSFEELKNSFKRENSITITQSEPRPTKSYSMVSGRNIPLIGDTKPTQRKSWVVTPSSRNSTSSGTSILDRLSNQRLKRDSTPEFNSSYHYEDDSVQFDSSEPFCTIPDDEQTVSINMSVSMNNLPDSNDLSNNDLQSSNITNNLPVFKPELSTSRRDTFTIDDGPLMIQQINTPAPRRSILKGSKTVKTRSRSSCRMVQFARLPNTDSRIKLSKNHFNSKSNFTVTDDETVNETDCSIDSKKSMQFDIEDLDDDLDGVQPLDSSVSFLINSPILDNSNIKKSSKRRSRGNKVMSLVNSIEKQRSNESPKLSIRASDLLSMNGSKHNNSSLNGSQNNASKLEESASSTRRINLENIFKEEDSSKDTTSNLGDETLIPQRESLEQASEINSQSVNQNGIQASDLLSMNGSKHNNSSLNGSQNNASKLEESASSTRHINLENIFKEDFSKYTTNNLGNETLMPRRESLEQASEINSLGVNQSVNSIGNVSSKKDTDDTFEQEYNFASPLNLQFRSNSNILSGNDQSTNVDLFKNYSITEVIGSQFDGKKNTRKSNKTPNMKNCVMITNNKHLRSSNNIDDSSSVYVKSPTLDHSNNSKTQINCSIHSEQTTENVVSTDDQKRDDKSTVKEKNNLNTQTNISKIMKEDHSHLPNDISKYAIKTNDVSKLNNSTNYEDSPSMIVQCMSKMLTPNESILETYVIEDDMPKTLEKNKSKTANNNITNESLDNKSITAIDNSTKNILDIKESIKEQQDILHKIRASSNSNQENIVTDSMSNTKNNETITSGFVSKQVETTNLPVEINDNISEHFMNSLLDNESTKTMSCSVTKNKSMAVGITINYSSNIDNSYKTELGTKSPGTDVALNKNNSTKPTKKIVKVLSIDSSSDDDVELENNDHMNKTFTNDENTFDTSIGKPQHESTPWTSSKTKSNSTSNLHSNDILLIKASPETVNRSPLPHPDIWSQMMKDFNQSVKKGSFSDCKAADVHTVSKVLFNSESNTCPTIVTATAEELFTNDANMAGSVEKNTIQCSLVSSCLPNNATQTPDIHVIRRSTRNSNNSLRSTIVREISPIVNAVQVKSTEKAQVNTSKSTIIDVISSDENNISLNGTKTNLPISSQLEKSSSVLEVNTNCATNNGLAVETSDSERNTTSDGRNYSSSSKSPQTSNKTKRVVRTRKINSNLMTSLRKNVRSQKNNESIKKQTSTRIVTEKTLTSSDTEKSSSISEKKLRSKLNAEKKSTVKDANKLTSSIKSKKNIKTNSIKSGLTENLINPSKTRITRSSTTLTELSLPKSNKRNKTLSPVESKSYKAEKPKKIKSFKPNKKTQSKRLLPSNPIKTSSDTSEYESEDNTSKPLLSDIPSTTNRKKIKKGVKENPQLVDIRSTRNKEKKKDDKENCLLIDPPKKIKENIKIKDVQSVDHSPVFTTKRSEKEKIEELTPKVTSPLCTRSRKRLANTPVSQPNAKGSKRDTSSKTASTAISLVTTSLPQIKTASSKNCTQNKSKLTALQISDSSLPETSVNKKDKPVTRAKKRALSSEGSCDSLPSAKKVTRQRANETELKKSTASTRASSRTKDQNLAEPTISNSTKVKFKKYVDEKIISPKSKKTRSTTQTVPKPKNVSPPPRVLRTREKKK